ncbi:alpha/beta hydrolase-fold protein [Parabacteroides sp. PF5-9]|uniref:alpha/beta hydrolase n=1 Tax=Parabacteroides sp. PF5-9 TaxID=1742404 RepID=UPI0024759777|nr:alpha/beta hydrolase-fold protein [Parabacteroides sp. PF5-9]MDH6356364.1 putative alpha/beta superfamily hydrolase [Parabacteroides sp. PF5-9]
MKTKNLFEMVLILVAISFFSCNTSFAKSIPVDENPTLLFHRVFSGSVNDTLSISVSLPASYYASDTKNYPVIYILDGNLYFDIFKSMVNIYTQTGWPYEVILVGIGYKNIPELAMLRSRDYTYPVAEERYGMNVSGGGDKFLTFLNKELLPDLDKKYRTDKANRILFGHSLSAYFVEYAFIENLKNNNEVFQSYIAASPTLNYNKYYLLKAMENLEGVNPTLLSKTSIFTSFGQLENASPDPEMEKVELTTEKLEKLFTQDKFHGLKHRSIVYSHLGHMETAIPTLMQGIIWTFTKE